MVGLTVAPNCIFLALQEKVTLPDRSTTCPTLTSWLER